MTNFFLNVFFCIQSNYSSFNVSKQDKPVQDCVFFFLNWWFLVFVLFSRCLQRFWLLHLLLNQLNLYICSRILNNDVKNIFVRSNQCGRNFYFQKLTLTFHQKWIENCQYWKLDLDEYKKFVSYIEDWDKLI